MLPLPFSKNFCDIRNCQPLLMKRGNCIPKVKKYVEREHLTQTKAAKRLGVTQPRLSEFKNGHINLFTIDKLVTMLECIGIDVSLKVKRQRAATAIPCGGPTSGDIGDRMVGQGDLGVHRPIR